MINRLSYSRLGNISFIALVTISCFVPRSLRSLVTKYDIVSRAIKLISPRLSYDNLYIYINHPSGGSINDILYRKYITVQVHDNFQHTFEYTRFRFSLK